MLEQQAKFRYVSFYVQSGAAGENVWKMKESVIGCKEEERAQLRGVNQIIEEKQKLVCHSQCDYVLQGKKWSFSL